MLDLPACMFDATAKSPLPLFIDRYVAAPLVLHPPGLGGSPRSLSHYCGVDHGAVVGHYA
jgi:hypothetical protein